MPKHAEFTWKDMRKRVTGQPFWVVGWGLVAVFAALPAAALEVPVALSAGDIVFYTLALTCITLFSLGMILTRQYHWLTYSIYGCSTVMLIASLDGTFAYLSGGDRWLMSDAPLLVGAVTAGFGFAHVAYRLESGHWLFATRHLHLAFAVLMLALIPLYFSVPLVAPNLVPLYATLNTGMLLMFTAQILPPITWTQLSPGQHKATIIWPIVTAIVGVGGYTVHFTGAGFERDTLNLFNRVLLSMHLGHLLVFVSISVIEQIRARVAAEQAAAEAARAAAESALALEVSEREFERARTLAHQRSRQLASASHDLKQPIGALRQVIEQRAADGGGDVERLRDAIDYLDQLAGTYLNMGNRALDEASDAGLEIDQDGVGRERVPVHVILDTVAALFAEDARAKQMELIDRPAGYEVLVQPLALTRVLSNLVSNAIAHSGGSRILLGARLREGAVRIEVHDNGKGMSDMELEKARQIRVSGDTSNGSGLGVAIVEHQAQEQDWTFELKSQPGRGTSAYVVVPCAEGTADV